MKILQKDSQNPKEGEFMPNDLYDGNDINLEQPTMLVKSELKSESLGHIDTNALMVKKKKKGSTKKSKTKSEKYLQLGSGGDSPSAEEDLRLEKKLAKNLNVKDRKTKFEEYMEMEMKEGVISVEEDFALERKLAKRLKVKKGKLRGDDDELNMLFEGIPSVVEDAEEAPTKSLENIPIRKKPKKLSEQEIPDDEEAPTTNLENISVSNKRKRKKKSSQQETSDTEEALTKSPENISVRNKCKKKSSEQELAVEMEGDTVVGVSETVRYHGTEIAKEKVNAKYVAPHLRSMRKYESEEHSQIRRRLRGMKTGVVIDLL